ncbi:TPA: hypothetical protein DEP34_03890 [Candidatus Uhrbacteria bacterium]|nr:hypothetical protein [Candidatus Uhrbacteria bacterium]HCB19496.1 hypothetical protein [Candidatus Uhrbacteria bacterium]
MWKHDSPDYPDQTHVPYKPVQTTGKMWSYCPNCGTSIKSDHLFCTQCGKKIEKLSYLAQEGGWCKKCRRRLDIKLNFCPYCGGASDKSLFDKPHCPKCRSILEENAEFCVGCGKKLINLSASPSTPSSARKRGGGHKKTSSKNNAS